MLVVAWLWAPALPATLEAAAPAAPYDPFLAPLPQAPAPLQRAASQRPGVQSLDDVERTTILQALAQCHGNKKKAAELLGIQRPTLYNKLKRYAIEL